ncbi:carboxylesterase/lipase family protein [soil metagenome]
MKLTNQPIRWLAAAGILIPLLSACGGGSDTPPQMRSTTYGQIEGVNDAATGTYYWKGIPFAKPPVGTLRWKAPVEPDAWTTTLSTKTFGSACAQYGRIYGPGTNNTYDATIGTSLNTPVGKEDCLTLNVWRPAGSANNLPVIYFIYGGSNVSGYTADPVYDGAALAKSANAVVVTANYRVGLFGWFGLPQLKTGVAADAAGDSGNFGTLDQIQTLKFINKNIANFGGNPANVTVMGQSAGAVNLYALMTSPLVVSSTTKLFHKAIPLSGGMALASELPAGSIATLNPVSYSVGQANALLYSFLIADGKATDNTTAAAYAATQTNAQIADYIRGKSHSDINTMLLTKLAPAGLSSTSHIPEGVVVPASPMAAISAGNYLKVPVMAGTTTEEAKLFTAFFALSPALGGVPGFIVTDASRFSTMYSYNPDTTTPVTIESLINAAYLPVNTPSTGLNARSALLGSIFITPNANVALNALSAQQPASVWYYQFNWAKEPAPWNDIYGAAHAFDLPFVFGNFGPSLFANVTNSTANKPGRLELSNAMMSSVAAFAANGDPNNAALGVTWPVYPKKLIFDATLTNKSISVQ